MTAPRGDAISVALLAGGRIEALGRCLVSLAEGTVRPGQIVAVNNRRETRDEVHALLLAFSETTGIPVTELPPVEGGFAEARNRAIAACHHDLVAVLDDDCYADRLWLERHGEALSRHEAVGGVMLPWARLRPPADWPPESNWLVGLSTPGCLGPLGGIAHYATTSNVSFHKRLWERYPFQEVGGDLSAPDAAANYRVGREDADWWARLRESGVNTGFETRAIVWHDINPKRFSLASSASRAEADGVSRWSRMRDERDLPDAARDVVHAPVRWVVDSVRTPESIGQVRRRHADWTRRQWSLLQAAVEDYEGDFLPQHRAGLLAREAGRLARDLAKAGLRRSIATGWRAGRGTPRIPTMERPPRRIGVVCYPYLGDALLMIPALEDLRVAFPDATITLFLGGAAAPLFENFTAVDVVEVLPQMAGGLDPRGGREFLRLLKRARPDVLVVAFHHGAPAYPLLACGAPVIMWDQDNGIRQQLWLDMADVRVPKNPGLHEMANVMNLLAPMGVPTRVRPPRVSVTEKARGKASAVLAHHGLRGGDYAVVHLDVPETSHKHWPWERFGVVARHLASGHGLTVFFHGHRRGRGPFEMLGLDDGRFISLHGQLDSMELAALLERARVNVGVDSGPQHIGQAVDCPTLVLFDTWLEPRWRPLPQEDGRPSRHRTVLADNVCRDWAGFELARLRRNEGYLRLAPAEVIRALDQLIEETT